MAAILDGCVASLRSSMQLLDSSITILDSGVSDFPRLSKVLQTTRHFELISEPALHTAQSALHSEIHPEVSQLLARVDNHLAKLERREQSLIAKCDLQQGRLSRSGSGGGIGDGERSSSAFVPRKSVAGGPAGVGGGGSSLEGLKAQALRQKKERLSYAVERLTLQAQQRERQLRMSMAPQVRDTDF